MGISIHYSGRLRDNLQLEELVLDVVEIANRLGWKYILINNEEVNGNVLSPKNCETIWLCFDDSGAICDPAEFKYVNEDGTFL